MGIRGWVTEEESKPTPTPTPTPAPTQSSIDDPVQGALLFIGQLPFSKSEADLERAFCEYGQVAEVVLHRDNQGKKKGGAFVRFVSPEDATEARLELNGYMFPGSTRPITVSVAGEGVTKKRRVS